MKLMKLRGLHFTNHAVYSLIQYTKTASAANKYDTKTLLRETRHTSCQL